MPVTPSGRGRAAAIAVVSAAVLSWQVIAPAHAAAPAAQDHWALIRAVEAADPPIRPLITRLRDVVGPGRMAEVRRSSNPFAGDGHYACMLDAGDPGVQWIVASTRFQGLSLVGMIAVGDFTGFADPGTCHGVMPRIVLQPGMLPYGLRLGDREDQVARRLPKARAATDIAARPGCKRIETEELVNYEAWPKRMLQNDGKTWSVYGCWSTAMLRTGVPGLSRSDGVYLAFRDTRLEFVLVSVVEVI